jgi:ketosteroid isomerase-like protein
MNARIIAALSVIAMGLSTASAANFGTVEDRLMIEDICAHYVMALDTADADAYAALFTEDAVLEVNGKPNAPPADMSARQSFHGRKEIHKMVVGFKAMMPKAAAGRGFGSMRHVVTSLALDIKGNTATGDSFWMEVQSNGKDLPPSIFNMGRYEDRYIKQNGKWLFASRLIIADMGYEPRMGAPPAAR